MAFLQFGSWKMAALLLVLVTVPLCAKSDLPAQENGKYTLKSCVNEFTMSGAKPTKVGYQYWFIDKDFLDGRTVKMSVVNPHDATHEPHRHAEDEIFFVIEGKAEVYLNGEKMALQPYATFYCPPNSEHGIRNIGDTELKYLVMKKIDR